MISYTLSNMIRYRVLLASHNHHHHSIFSINTYIEYNAQILHYKSSSHAKKFEEKEIISYYRERQNKNNKQKQRVVLCFDLILQCVQDLILPSRRYCTLRPHLSNNVREFDFCTWLQAPIDHWVSGPEQGRCWQVLDCGRVDGGVRHAPSATVIVNVGVISCRQTISRFCTPSPQLTEHSPHSPTTHLK